MADEIEDGGPAFPYQGFSISYPGMSLRDKFADGAMRVALHANISLGRLPSSEFLAKSSYELADAMLVARKKLKESK